MTIDPGPTWYDLSTAAETLRDQYSCAIEFRLVPPIKRLDGRGYTTWAGCVYVTRLGAGERPGRGFNTSWGARGAFRTAPGALYRALLDAEEWLAQRQAEAERKAAF